MSTQYSCFECGANVTEDGEVAFSEEMGCDMPICGFCANPKLVKLLTSPTVLDDNTRLTLSEVHDLGLFMASMFKNKDQDECVYLRTTQIVLDGYWAVTPELRAIMAKLVIESD